jgi:ribosomal protein S16
MQHALKVDVDAILGWIAKWAQPSERVAKLLLKETKNEFFNKFIEHRERKGVTKKEEKK